MEYVYSATDNAKQTVDADDGNKPFASTQWESAFSFYVGFNKRFGKKGLIGVSAQAEYFKSTLDSVQVNKSKVLWNTFSVYPRVTFMYKLGKYGSMQFALSSQKHYPPYWVTASNRTAINNYCFNEGNPELKPYTRYSLLHSKYIFGAFYEYCNDYYTQLLTQSDDELSAVYKYYNMERSTKVGVMSVVPVKWGTSFNIRFTGMLLSMFQKGR